MHQLESRPPLDVDAIRTGLAGSPAGRWRVDVVEETGSTNADMLARAAAGEDVDGSVLLAEYQTAGRGRRGRHWSAPARSQIALSVGVSARDIPADAWGWLPLLTGVAVVDAVAEAADLEAGLKWPNDVLVGQHKLAGILAEVAAPQPLIVVGLGLNVTMTADEAPDPAAVSLTMLGARRPDRDVLTAGVLRHLASRIDRWRAVGGADDTLVTDYRRRSLTLGTQVRARLPGDRTVEGIADAIDDLGRLTIKTDISTGSEEVTVSAGDITHLRPRSDTDAG